MKRLLILILSLCLLAGCAGEENTTTEPTSEPATKPVGETIESSTAETATATVEKVNEDEDDANHYIYDEESGRYLFTGSYFGNYSVQYIELDLDYPDEGEEPEALAVMDLSEYAAYCAEWGFLQDYTEEGTYLVASASVFGVPNLEVDLGGVTYDAETKTACLYIYENAEGFTADFPAYLLAVPVDYEVEKLEYVLLTTKEDIERRTYEAEAAAAYKPILYLYPETETELTIRLGKPEELTCTYPLYEDSWRVTAHPDGTLTDDNGRSYYALYWEGGRVPPCGEEGFCVAREELIPFLETSLAQLGLSEREAEEFIVYWLPVLQESPYVLLRFEGSETMAEIMPLEFSVQPDTMIRVLMEYRPLEQPIRITPQVLTAPERTGFVAVEWGGALIHR